MNILSINSPLFRFFSRVGDLILLNLLCILCCLPIFTIGASFTAMYYVTLRVCRKDDVRIVHDFFHSFRQNFKQGIVVHILFSVITIILALDLYVLWQLMEFELFYKILFGALTVLCIWFSSICLYTYPLLAQFHHTIRGILKNAQFMSLKHISYTLAMLLVSVAPWIVGLYMPYVLEWLIIIFLFIGFSATALFNCRYFVKIFDQYIHSQNS